MSVIYIMFSALFILCLGCRLGWFEKPYSPVVDEVELKRRLAKNKGYVLHNEAYRCGVELYVQPQDQSVSYEFMKQIGLDRFTF